jgi:hypothetical protein
VFTGQSSRLRFIFAAVAAVQSCLTDNVAVSQEASQMYGLIGKVTSVPPVIVQDRDSARVSAGPRRGFIAASFENGLVANSGP